MPADKTLIELLKSPEADAKATALIQKLRAKDAPMNRASAEVFPGPLRDAFALAQDIQVGPYKVRAFVDIDFEFLAILDHPLDRMIKDQMEGIESKVKFLPTGAAAWQAYWIMTRPVDEVESMLSLPDGKEGLKQSAKKEFSRYPMAAMGELYKAVMHQIITASSTTLQLGPDDAPVPETGEDAVAVNPPQPLHQATG